MFRDQFIGLGSNFFGNSLCDKTQFVDAEFLPVIIKLLPLLFSILAILSAYLSTKITLQFINLYAENTGIRLMFRFLSHK